MLVDGVLFEALIKAFVEFDSGVIQPSIPLSKSASRAIVGVDVGTGVRVGLKVGADVIVGAELVGVIVGTVFLGVRNVNGSGAGRHGWRYRQKNGGGKRREKAGKKRDSFLFVS